MVVAVCFGIGAAVALPEAARAEQNPPGVMGAYDTTRYAYLNSAEVLDVSFALALTGGTASSLEFRVLDPSGDERWSCAIDAPAQLGDDCSVSNLTGEAGVWTVETLTSSAGADEKFVDWSVVVSDSGSPRPGRVWTSDDGLRQHLNTAADLDYWAVNDAGFIYQVSLLDYNGYGSHVRADSVGNRVSGDACIPAYESQTMGTDAGPGDCAAARLFYEEPDPALPSKAPSAAGVVPVLPIPLTPSELQIDDLVFTADSATTRAGLFTFTPNERFEGSYFLEVDTNGNGTYSEVADRRIQLWADGSAPTSYRFDGLDGAGTAISACSSMNARIFFERLGEIHFLNTDVEGRDGGISVTRTNGPNAPDSTLYWNDTNLAPREPSPSILDGRAGIVSAAGVHGWPNAGQSWGDSRWIEEWTYAPVSEATGDISIPGRCLAVTKTSDAAATSRVGDTVRYTVTATNTGQAPYTTRHPAVVIDDLSDVLDDATFNDDARSTVGGAAQGAPTYMAPVVSWSGALGVGESVELTYSVKLTGQGDAAIKNVAYVGDCDPGTAGCNSPPPPACDPRIQGVDLTTGTPCDVHTILLPGVHAFKVSDPVSGTAAAAGQVITYTLTWVNSGAATGRIDSTDDLSDVLDDATLTAEPRSSRPEISAAVSGDALTIAGELRAGETVHVTYQVTINADGRRGNNAVENVLVPRDPDQCAPGVCATLAHVGELVTKKQVNPMSGTSVQAGGSLTYTLEFTNVGKAEVEVDKVDYLGHLLDDADLTGAPSSRDSALSVSAVAMDRFSVAGTLGSGQTAIVTYSVRVKPDGQRGDGIVANYLMDPSLQPTCAPGQLCEPRCGDADEPCTVNYVSDVRVTKSSDPTSGAEVASGQRVTYALTFTNTASNPGSTPARVEFTDHMEGVLDDAVIDGEPASFAGSLTASTVGQQIVVTGTLAAGQTARVEYTVVVKPFGDQGDRVLRNVIAPTGREPVCTDGNGMCTAHPTTPDRELALTGADGFLIVSSSIVALGALSAGLVLLYSTRGRRGGAAMTFKSDSAT